MLSLIKHRRPGPIFLVAIASALAAPQPSSAIQVANSSLDFFSQIRGQKYENSVFKQFAFDVDFDEDSFSTTIGQTANSISTAWAVNDRYLVTAAHTVYDSGWFQYEIGDEIYTANQWWVPSGYGNPTSPPEVDDEDIAIVQLDRPIDNIALEPLPLIGHDGTPGGIVLSELDRNLLIDAEYTAVGFGDTTVGPTGSFFGSGVLRAADNRFDLDPLGGFITQQFSLLSDNDNFDNLEAAIDELRDTLQVDPDVAIDFDEFIPDPFEGVIQSGDSGGPAIVDGQAVGVASYGFFTDGEASFGGTLDATAHTNIQRFIRMLDAIGFQQDASAQTDIALSFGVAGIEIPDFIEDDDGSILTELINNRDFDGTLLHFFDGVDFVLSPFLRDFDGQTTLPPDLAGIVPFDLSASGQEITNAWTQMFIAMADGDPELLQALLAKNTVDGVQIDPLDPNSIIMGRPAFETEGYGALTEATTLGDFDGDGKVGSDDLLVLIENFGKVGQDLTTTGPEGENILVISAEDNYFIDGNLTLDNVVDANDLAALLESFAVTQDDFDALLAAVSAGDTATALDLFGDLTPLATLFEADLDGDGDVDVVDLDLFGTSLLSEGADTIGDIDGDGDVDVVDLDLFGQALNYFNNEAFTGPLVAVPEPGTLALLAAGGLVLTRRRRR